MSGKLCPNAWRDGLGLAKWSAALQTCSNRPGVMSPSLTQRDPDGSQAPLSSLPSWMRWGGAGLTALLAVLFVVLLQQVHQQAQQLQLLQDRVQTLENAKDLERTNALEEQVRATVRRLQNLEGLRASLQRLRGEQESLRQQIRANDDGAVDETLTDDPVPPPAKPQP